MKNKEKTKKSENKKEPAETKYRFGSFAIVFLAIICYICLCKINIHSTQLIEFSNSVYEKNIIESYIKQDYTVWNEIVRYAKNVNRFYIYHRNFYNISDSDKVTAEDMAEDMYRLNENLNSALSQAASIYNDTILDNSKSEAEKGEAEDSFRLAVNKALSDYSYDIKATKESKLKERITNYSNIQGYFDTTREFVYYITDSRLNRSFSNIVGSNLNSFMENETYVNIDITTIHDTFNGIPLSDSFIQNGISGYILIPKDQPAGSYIEQIMANAQANKDYENTELKSIVLGYSLCLSAVIILMGLIISKSILKNVSASRDGFLLVFKGYLLLPVTLKIILAGIAISSVSSLIVWPASIGRIYYINLIYTALRFAYFYIGVTLAVFTAAYAVFMARGKYKFKDEFEYKLSAKIFRNISIMRKLSPVVLPAVSIIMLCAIVFFILSGLYFLIYENYYLYGIMAGVFFIVAAILLCSILLIVSYYAKLSYYIKNIYEGNPTQIPEESGFFAAPLNMLNSLSEGLKKSLDEMLISERTKTELITNVSHDLKTPLTSIINYVDLLQKSNITDSCARQYIEVLAQKSDRLRILIEDLFEASKLSSRSMELVFEPVDVVQLLEQAIGELSEKIESARLDIKFSSNAEKIIIMLDGKRMWRVFENLLNNIVNYSPMGSRVYITISEYESYIEITMKNISAYELDFDGNELFERFKRGDTARTTEGSGLGLSISKNIVELHGGKMEIVIDGDLFKVITSLNKSLA